MSAMRSQVYLDPRGYGRRFDRVVRALPAGDVDLGNDDLTIARDGRLRIVYVPFDLINPHARLIVVGLTPGAQQSRLALAAARDTLARRGNRLESHRQAKQTAAFAGSLRANLIGMLDAVGIPAALGIVSSAELFGDGAALVHPTSALRYAVFRDDRNYSGNPSPIRTPLLRQLLDQLLGPELGRVPGALVVPLGDRVSQCLVWLAADDRIDPGRILFGFPHPSGANGHRHGRFAAMRRTLSGKVRAWYRPSAAPPPGKKPKRVAGGPVPIAVPDPMSDWPTIERFALTYNPYQRVGEFSVVAAQGKAARAAWDRTGALPDDLQAARTALFFVQRSYRHFEQTPSGLSATYARALVARIAHLTGGYVPGPPDPFP